jgi:hypothetical protein
MDPVQMTLTTAPLRRVLDALTSDPADAMAMFQDITMQQLAGGTTTPNGFTYKGGAEPNPLRQVISEFNAQLT